MNSDQKHQNEGRPSPAPVGMPSEDSLLNRPVRVLLREDMDDPLKLHELFEALCRGQRVVPCAVLRTGARTLHTSFLFVD